LPGAALPGNLRLTAIRKERAGPHHHPGYSLLTRLQEKDYEAAVNAICREHLGLAPDESLLVVADPPLVNLAGRIAGLASGLCRSARLLRVGDISRAGLAPAGFTFEALALADCALLVTSKSLSHTDVRRRACREAGRRIASLPGLTENMLLRLFASGRAEDLRRRTERLAAKVQGTREVCLRTPAGTDLELSVAGRRLYLDTGIYRERGSFGNLPAGEVSWAPAAGSARGKIVVDVAFAGIGAVDRLELEIETGAVVSAAGSQSDLVMKILAGPAERVLAEFGIGANPLATPCGITLEAEKAVGTVHFGFGDNRSFGGENAANGHWDAVLRCRGIDLDGKLLSLADPDPF